MAKNALLVDLDRAYELLTQVDESKLDFTPDENVSADIRSITNLETYPETFLQSAYIDKVFVDLAIMFTPKFD